MRDILLRFWREDNGQDMVEYALLLSFILVCAVGILSATRDQISDIWSTINSALSSAVTNAAS